MYRNTLVGEMDFFAGDWYVSHFMPISPLNQVNQRIFMIPAVKGSTCMYIQILYKHYIVWLFTIYPQQASYTEAKPFRNCVRWKELSSTVYWCLLSPNHFKQLSTFKQLLIISPTIQYQPSNKVSTTFRQIEAPAQAAGVPSPAAVPSCDSSRFEPLRVLGNTDLRPG